MMKANLFLAVCLAAKCAVLTALMSTVTKSSLMAQPTGERQTVPDSVDPLLRIVPLEKERVRPDPTPNLKVPMKPGFQAVVLRDYASVAGRTDIAAPVVLYIPSKFYRKTSDQPFEVWGLNFLLFWPDLTPLQDHPECVPFTCDSIIILSIQLTHRDIPLIEYESLLDNIKTAKSQTDPAILYNPADTIPGFSESYTTTAVKLPQGMNRKNRIFIDRREDGKIISYTECSTDAPKPQCRTDRKSTSRPEINIKYSENMRFFLSGSQLLRQATENFVDSLAQ